MSDHLCLDEQAAELEATATAELPAEVRKVMIEKTGNGFILKGLYHDLETQIAALSNGFVAGRASAGQPTPENMLIETLSKQFCPRCLFLWLEQTEGCCFTHTIAALLMRGGNMAIVEVNDSSCTPFDPSLN